MTDNEIDLAVELLEHSVLTMVKSGGAAAPMVAAVREGKLVGTMLPDTFEESNKEQLWRQFATFLLALDADAGVIVADAFVSVHDEDTDPSEIPMPRDDPRATDAIIASVATRAGELRRRLTPYHLNDQGHVEVEETQVADDGMAASGWVPSTLRMGVMGGLDPAKRSLAMLALKSARCQIVLHEEVVG